MKVSLLMEFPRAMVFKHMMRAIDIKDNTIAALNKVLEHINGLMD